MEIERKFIIDKFPDMEPYLEADVLRFWFSTGTFEVGFSRFAVKGRKTCYTAVFKTDGNLAREEHEIEIAEEDFVKISAMTGQTPVRYDYRVYKLENGLYLECKLVGKGTEDEYFYAEVEFRSEEEAENWGPPAFLGKEITYDSYYKMKNYWKRTRLERKD